MFVNVLIDSDSFCWKPNKTKVHIMLSEVVTSDGDVKPPFIFSHGLKLIRKAYIKSQEEIVLTWIEIWMLEDPTSVKRDLYHATQAKETRVGCEKIFVTTSSLISGCVTPQTEMSLVMYVQRKTSKIPCNTKNELKAKITVTFSNLNKIYEKTCWRCQLPWWSQIRSIWIDLIYSNSRYFHVILVNISL